MSAASKEAKERYWKKKYDEASDIECECGCGQEIRSVDHYGRERRFVSGHNNRKYDHNEKQPHKKAWLKRNRKWANTRRQGIARERKVKFIHYLGGKCTKCEMEYDKTNGGAFEFHHVDPSIKEFCIGKELTNKSFASLKAEAEKCVLLCANCHQIEHLGEY